MGKAVGTILKVGAVIAGVAAVVATGGAALGLIGAGGSLLGLGISAGAFSLISTGLALGGSLLAGKPKAPGSSPAAVDRLQASISLRTPRTILVGGPTALATDVRDQEWSTDQSLLHRFIVVASHKVRSISAIYFDDKLAWTSASGVTATYAGYLTVTPVLEGSAANAINIGARMGSSRRYTGCAYVYLRYKLTGNNKKTESPFAGGSIPIRMTIVGEGIPVPDPRASGFNAADQATWSTNSSACRNPALVMLAYLLGWKINGKLAVGKGIPPARIDLASFASAANICDEPVTRPNGTTEPRYRCDGIFSEADETSIVLDNLKATMNAVLDDVDGKIRLSVLYNDLATPIGELTTADVLDDFTWDQTAPLSDSVNVIRGGYTDPSTTSLYQMVDYPEVRIASTDGIDRVQTINLPLVQSAGQAQRLAKLRLARFQFGGTFTAVFQATAWKFQKGDAIRFSFYPLGWDRKLFRIADMAIQVDGTVPMMLREEDPAIYAAYSDETAAVAGAPTTSYDPQLWPVIQGIMDVDAQIARAVSDGWLDPSEKRQAKIDYDQRTAQRDALQARYVDLGSPSNVTSARDNAFAKMQALYDYLQGLSPSWLDYTTMSQVSDPSAYQAAWKAAADALEGFGAAITGLQGPPGTNNATVTIYQRSASGAPALPSAVATYTYATASLSGLNNGWSTSIPAGTDPIYASAATASSTGATDTIAANEWATARQIASNGANGTSGLNNKSLFIYQRAASAPALPSQNATYTFSTAITAGLNNGWAATIPAANGLPLWVSTATALSPTDVDNINPGEWATAQKLAEDGADGANGGSAFTLLDVQACADPGPNFVVKRAGGNAWNGKARTREGGIAASVSGLLRPGTFIGLAPDPANGASWETIDCALHWSENTRLYLSRDGDIMDIGGRTTDQGPIRATVRSDATKAYYALEGYDLSARTHLLNAPGSIMYGTFAIYSQGSTIDGITFAVDGKAGADALGAPAAPESHAVACDFSGNPKPGETTKVSTIKVTAGTTDVTSASAIVVAGTSNCSASVSGATVTLSSFAGDVGYVDLTISYGGAATGKRITFNKARDGAPGNSNSAALTVANSATWTDSSAVISLAVQGAGTLQASAGWRSAVSNNVRDGGVRVLWRPAGTSTWAVFVEATQSGEAGGPFSVTSSATQATTGAGAYEFMAQTTRTGTHGAITPGRLSVSWQP